MTTGMKFKNLGASLLAAAVASVLATCASTSVRPAGAVNARARLTQFQSDPALASRAPLPTQAADATVRVVERPGADSDLEAYRVFIADRKINIVRAQAQTRVAEEQRPELRAESKKARIAARTLEVDLALSRAALTKAKGAERALAAATARGETDATPRAAAAWDQQASDARREAESAELAASICRPQTAGPQPNIGLLQARITDSGLVVTLAGFALFR